MGSKGGHPNSSEQTLNPRVPFFCQTVARRDLRRARLLPLPEGAAVDDDDDDDDHHAESAKIEGSLLALGHFLDDANNRSDEYVQLHFQRLCEATLQFTRSDYPGAVREATVKVIPRLAEVGSLP